MNDTETQHVNIEVWKEKYVKTLTAKEKQSYLIAKSHLGMSFQLEKSVGFLAWYTPLNNSIRTADELSTKLPVTDLNPLG